MSRTTDLYPDLHACLEALANPEGRFRTLGRIVPVCDRDGMPVFTSGTGRVTFELLMPEGESAKLTCFTAKPDADRLSRYAGELYPEELYVFDRVGAGNYYPVLLERFNGVQQILRATDQAGEMQEGRQLIVRDGLFGYADENGNQLIEPRYGWAGDFSEGRAAVSTPVADGGYMGLIDRDGQVIIPLEYDDLSWDGSRFAYVDREGKHGCLDRSGKVVISLLYDWIGEFSQGYAVVRDDRGRYGYVDENGVLCQEGLVYADASSVNPDRTAEVFTSTGERLVLYF